MTSENKIIQYICPVRNGVDSMAIQHDSHLEVLVQLKGGKPIGIICDCYDGLKECHYCINQKKNCIVADGFKKLK